MSYEITDVRRSGYFEAYFNGQKINRPNHSGNHTNENEAEQTIFWHAGTQPEGDYEYEIRPARTIINVRVVGSVAEPGDPPGIPQNFTATVVDHQQVNLSWSAVTDATGYQIYQDTSPIDTTSGTAYSVIGLSSATQYDFNVAAYNTSGTSSLSATQTVTTDTNAPPVWSLGNQSGETNDVFSILLDDFCTDPDGDTITYSLVSGTLPEGLSLTGARNETLEGMLTEVDTDVFTLGADDGVNTRVDVQITFTVTSPDLVAPAQPTGLLIADFDHQSITLDWDDNAEPDLSYYSVFRSSNGVDFGKVTIDGALTVSTYVDSGRSAETQYWYYVTATDQSGNQSIASSTENQTTLPAPSNADWTARSTAAGVVYAENEWSAATIDQATRDYQGNQFSDAGHVSRETTVKCSGGAALKFDILKTDGAASGAMRIPFGTQFTTGQTFYVQFRQYIPEYFATHAFSGTSGGFAEGWKQCIISKNTNSNQLFEVVLQNTVHRGLVQGYNRDTGGSYTGWEESYGGSDFVMQNQIDRGYGTATSLAERRTKGGLYSYGGNTGAPDPETGAFIFYPDEWLTFQVRVTVGTFGTGTADTRIKVWAARNGGDYVALVDKFVDIGNDPPNYYDAIWLLPYNTNRTADPTRQDTYTLYDELIVSTNFIPAPAVTVPTWVPSSGVIAEIGPSDTLTNIVNADLADTSGHAGTAYEILANWCGGDIVMKRGAPYLAVHGGGHGSGSINGVYGWGPLTGENPGWQILAQSSPSPTPINGPYYSDDKPNSTHTYGNLCGNDDHHLWLIKFEGVYSSGGDFSNTDRLDVDIGEWDGEGVHPNASTGGSINGFTAYKPGANPGEGQVFRFATGRISGNHTVLNEVTDSFAAITQENNLNGFYLSALTYDPVRDRLFWFDDGTSSYYTVNATTLAPIAEGSTSAIPEGNTHTLDYDPVRDVYIHAGRGNRNIHECDPVSLTWTTRTFSGATPAAGHTENNGHYNRFRVYRNGDMHIYIYCTSENSGMYIYGAN